MVIQLNHKLVSYTDAEFEREQWRGIPEYEGIYQASNLGRIRTAPGKTTQSVRHGSRKWATRVLKNRGTNPVTGHRVTLWKDKQPKEFLVARLVAMTWLGIAEDGMTVNHINGNRFDNHIENLEWVSLADNIRHAFETGLMNTMAPVILVDEHKNPIYFRSKSEASRWLGKYDQYVGQQLRRGSRTACGYTIFTA